jgi:hypothetical protein
MTNKLFSLAILLATSLIIISCSEQSKTPVVEVETNNDDGYEVESEVQSSPISTDCKDKFDYRNNQLTYVYCCACDYWEEKLDEYLYRNEESITQEEKLQNISSDLSLEPYVKKIHGFSSLEEAKKAFIKAGGDGKGIFRFKKPIVKK